MTKQIFHFTCWSILAFAGLSPAVASAQATLAPSPAGSVGNDEGKSADLSKPVQVFVLLGQSNMVGLGNVGARKGRWKMR